MNCLILPGTCTTWFYLEHELLDFTWNINCLILPGIWTAWFYLEDVLLDFTWNMYYLILPRTWTAWFYLEHELLDFTWNMYCLIFKCTESIFFNKDIRADSLRRSLINQSINVILYSSQFFNKKFNKNILWCTIGFFKNIFTPFQRQTQIHILSWKALKPPYSFQFLYRVN